MGLTSGHGRKYWGNPQLVCEHEYSYNLGTTHLVYEMCEMDAFTPDPNGLRRWNVHKFIVPLQLKIIFIPLPGSGGKFYVQNICA